MPFVLWLFEKLLSVYSAKIAYLIPVSTPYSFRDTHIYISCKNPRRSGMVFKCDDYRIIARILKPVVASEAKQSRSTGYAFACAGLLRFARNDGLFTLPQLYYFRDNGRAKPFTKLTKPPLAQVSKQPPLSPVSKPA